MPMCVAMLRRQQLVWRHSVLFLHLETHLRVNPYMIIRWTMAITIYLLIMVLIISLVPVYSTSKPYNNQTAAYAPTSL